MRGDTSACGHLLSRDLASGVWTPQLCCAWEPLPPQPPLTEQVASEPSFGHGSVMVGGVTERVTADKGSTGQGLGGALGKEGSREAGVGCLGRCGL